MLRARGRAVRRLPLPGGAARQAARHDLQITLLLLLLPSATSTSAGVRAPQVVQVGSYALINIHPGPARPGDPVLEVLGEVVAQLLQQPPIRVVHIVGDWNRSAAQWAVPPRFAGGLLRWLAPQYPPARIAPARGCAPGLRRQWCAEDSLGPWPCSTILPPTYSWSTSPKIYQQNLIRSLCF